MHIKGLVLFKSSIDQEIAYLYFLRVSGSFSSSSSVNAAEIITGFAFSGSKKAYFKCLGNSFKVNPSEFFYVSLASSSLLHVFFVLFSFKLKSISFNSQLEYRNSQSRSSRYWKFISFSLIEF